MSERRKIKLSKNVSGNSESLVTLTLHPWREILQKKEIKGEREREIERK